jgi:murein DD-endopeptidase MepM/ murein hydrolase activator NlpD
MRGSAGRVRTLSRFVAIALIGGLAAGCSSDSLRFAGSPFSNPFASKSQSSEPRITGSVPAAPRSYVSSQPLPAPLPRAAASAPAYQPYTPRKSTALPAPRQTPVTNTGPGGWTAEGGTLVTVGPGENVNVIANRYGVPASAIISANKLASASQAVPGRRMVIPVYNAAGPQFATNRSPAPLGQGRLRLAETAKGRPMKQTELPKQHTRPGHMFAKAEPLSTPRPVEPIRTARAAAEPMPKAWAPAPQSVAPAWKQESVQPAREPEQTASLPKGDSADFRWPARGRVISGFGGPSGNEGINIALPEGTPVKAAESGTVAYAGSEVKGYGNLVLIRHDNGFVSAYAHNGEISVKRGDRVRRGQVIAKSGQTGNVTSPQLHFEIRKGSTPVDPIPHLEGN